MKKKFYEGEFENGEFQGSGKLFDDNEIVKYQGKFVKSKRHGPGILFLSNNTRIEGKFVDDELVSGKVYEKQEHPENQPKNPQKGKTNKPTDLLKYDGGFKNNQKHGNGTLLLKSGNKFIGDFFDNKRSGNGKLYRKNGEVCYSGTWKNDKQSGKGMIKFKTGHKYEGEVLDNKRQGQGVYYWNEHTFYTGNWENDERSGTGTLSRYGLVIFEGEWMNDRYKSGIYNYHGDKSLSKYKGGFNEAGERHGNGEVLWNDGSKYAGDWVDDVREGKGTEFFGDGKVKYVGDWKGGKKMGVGSYYFKNGVKYEGDWVQDLRHGKGSLFDCDGNLSYKGDWFKDNGCSLIRKKVY